jgi:hypothetical protein
VPWYPAFAVYSKVDSLSCTSTPYAGFCIMLELAISTPSEVDYCERPDQRCYRLRVVTIGSRDIVLEHIVPKARCDAAVVLLRGYVRVSASKFQRVTPRRNSPSTLVVRPSVER